MTHPVFSRLLPHLWKSMLFSGVLTVILGGLVLTWPAKTILVAAILFGVYLLIIGAAQVTFAFSLHVGAGARVLLIVSGVAALILAVLCFRHFGADREYLAVLLLAIWIAVGFIFRGMAITVAAVNDPGLPGRGWQILLGVLYLLAGVVTLALPFTSLLALTLAVGVWLVVVGTVEITVAISTRSAMRELTSQS